MKRNFYLQHPLMAMHDPRMQYLLKMEKLKGTGAYWFVIEKLAMLPGSCVDMEFLRPYCKMHKISFAYVKKIILGYELFDFEEDGSFAPAELNPLHKPVQKREETVADKTGKPEDSVRKTVPKTTGNVSESSVSWSKNDEKRQKTSREKAEKRTGKSDKTLNDSIISESVDTDNKENIKDIITAATVEEKDATATTAINHSYPLNICDDYGQSQQMLHPVRPWQNMVDELTTRTPWLETACMQSCYGELLMRNIQKAVEIFKCHIELYDKGGDLLTMSEVRRYFVNYTKAGKPTSQALRETLIAFEAKQRATLPPNAYLHEQLINGKRTYLGCLIPDDAPARPSDTAFWNEQEHRWISQR